MTKLLVIVVALLALAGALWRFTAAPSARGTRAELPIVKSTSTATEEHPSELGSIPVVDELTPIRGEPFLPASADAVVPSSSREPASRLSSELTPPRWVEGRVVIPAGTPADEKLFVLANERASPRAVQHRVAVAPDGSFRVAFHAKTSTAYFELEARYLYLERRVLWSSNGSTGSLVLEPLLGARLAGRVIVPAGTDPGSVGGVVELRTLREGVYFGEIKKREVTAKLAFEFDALVPASAVRGYELRYDGARFVGKCGGLVLEAGRTLNCELLLRTGVTLAGVVRDSTGQPMRGVQLTALPSYESTSSADDGTFQLVALEAGKIVLEADNEGLEPVRRELGELVDGMTLTDIEFVLGEGKAISGVVNWPDGAPAVPAAVNIWAEGSDPAGDFLSAFCQTAPDGRFSVAGLRGKTYRIWVWSRRLETVDEFNQRGGVGDRKPHSWMAELRDVPAGTSDVVLTLSLSLAISGTVTDELGAPVTDFRIEARRVEPGLLSMRNEAERIDSFRTPDGSFGIMYLTQGDWSLLVRSEGYSDLFLTVTPPTTARLQLVLTR